MNAFEQGLRRGIPFEKAAAYFCSLKNFPLRGEDDALMAACVKQAAAEQTAPKDVVAKHRAEFAGMYGDADVDPNVVRQNAYIVQNDPAARAALDNDPRNQPGRTLKSTLLSAAGGGLAGLTAAGLAHPTGKGLALGAAGGALLGGALAPKQRPGDYAIPEGMPHIEAATQHGLKYKQDFIGQLPEEWKTASAEDRLEYFVQRSKLAEEDSMPAEADALTPPGSQGKGKDNGAAEYIANEAAAQEATDTNSVSYYQQVMEQLRAELGDAQEQAQQATEQAEQLQQQQEGHEQQIAAATQEGQIAQQAAIQQVNAANTMASQAMQQTVSASNSALQAKATETTAKIQQQALRSQLFDLASEGLPGTEPELGGEGNAAEGLEPTSEIDTPQAGGAPGGDPNGDPNAEGAVEEGATDGQEAGAEAGLNETGDPAQDPAQAPEGAPAAAAPDAAPPGGGGGEAPPQANADAATAPTTEKNRQVSIKVGALSKTAGLMSDPRVLGGLAGAALGAGAAGLEASGHGPKTQDLQAKVDAGQQAVRKPGLGGFVQALDLAGDRMKLTASEATQSHPVAATITGGLLGAGVGASAGPQLKKLVTEAAQLHKR